MSSLTEEEANEMLPSAPTKASSELSQLIILLIGPPKWGKTTLACSADDSILLATERGHAFHETHKIEIDAWDKSREDRGVGVDEATGIHHLSMIEAVDAICASNRFKTVIIDTADRACKMCLAWHYKKRGVEHASDAGDYGKGWDLCLTQPFTNVIGKLMTSGRGIIFITHSNIITKKVGRVETSREETTLPSQVQKFLHTQADLIVHGQFGRLRKGMQDRDRIINLDGSAEILAGSRVRHIHLPRKYIVSPTQPWAQLANFFKDPKAVLAAEAEYQEKVLKGTGAVAEEAGSVISESASEPKSDGVATTKAATEPAKAHKRSRK